MKAKTRQEKEVCKISKTLPKLEYRKQGWAFNTCISHWGFRTKAHGISCLCCGHTWRGDEAADKAKCPHCNRMLRVKTTRQKKLSQMDYCTFLTNAGGYQINRVFQIHAHMTAGEKPRIFFWEIAQQYLRPDGKHQIIARLEFGGMFYRSDTFSGELELRKSFTIGRYDAYNGYVYPEMKVLPELTRNGFTGEFYGVSPYKLFTHLLRDSMSETLFKAGYYGFLQSRIYKASHKMDRYWASVKICLRNNYNLPADEVGTWLDYVELLDRYNKDLKNPALVCPDNLAAEHNKWVAIDHAQRERQRRIDDTSYANRMKKAEKNYPLLKAKYLHLLFTDGDLSIRVLQDIADFQIEGNTHHHCVFGNAYYAKENSLILSASIGGVRTETVEVHLPTMTISQSRGLGNQSTKYNERIKALVNANMHQIQAAHTGKARKKKKAAQAA